MKPVTSNSAYDIDQNMNNWSNFVKVIVKKWDGCISILAICLKLFKISKLFLGKNDNLATRERLKSVILWKYFHFSILPYITGITFWAMQ